MSTLTVLALIVLAVYSVIDFYKSAFELSRRSLIGRGIGLLSACGFSILLAGWPTGLVVGFATYVLAVKVGRSFVDTIGRIAKRVLLKKVANVDEGEEDV